MPENVPCKWCGMEMAANAEICPWCYRSPSAPQPTSAPRAYAQPGAPRAAAATESATWSEAADQPDPVLFALQLFVAANAVIFMLAHSWWPAVVNVAVLAGIVYRRRWTLWMVLILETLSLLGALALVGILALTLAVANQVFPFEVGYEAFGMKWGIVHLNANVVLSIFALIVVIARRGKFR
jgi:hypothetical protein